MIFVERKIIEEPSWFQTTEVKTMQQSIHEFYAKNSFELLEQIRVDSLPNYERMVNATIRDRQCLNALFTLFRKKCAYCESPIHSTSILVDLFRPRAVEGSHLHYGWLTFEWDNYMLACPACNKAKKNAFPVNGQRADILSSIAVLRETERHLLIDPCYDQPNEHITFDTSGEALALTERGTTTIRVLELNRPTLVGARRNRLNEVRAVLEELQEMLSLDARNMLASYNLLRVVAEYESLDQPFHGCISAVFSDVFKNLKHLRNNIVHNTPSNLGIKVQHVTKSRRIRSIKVANLLDMNDFEITLNENDGSNWLMMLGENGVGKSTLLKLLALNLAGKERRERIRGFPPKELVKPGYNSGYIQLLFTGEPLLERTLSFQRNDTWGGTADRPYSGNVLGYGPVRLVSPKPRPMSKIYIRNLFSPYSKLVDMNQWLLNMYQSDKPMYLVAIRCIRSMMPLAIEEGKEFILEPEDGQLVFRNLHSPNSRVNFDALSSGYQNVFTLVCDILRNLRSSDESSIEGIVFLDELDVHLHPRWKMNIVRQLKAQFKSVQFISTAHDPLCLRGLKRGEIMVLNRTKERVNVHYEDLPSPEGLRADQLLTSEFFGMSSTVDPDTEKTFAEYYNLLAKQNRSPEENVRVDRIKLQLKNWRYMGNSRREQLMYEAIDQFLAKERQISAAELRQQAEKNKLMDRLKQIWQSLE